MVAVGGGERRGNAPQLCFDGIVIGARETDGHTFALGGPHPGRHGGHDATTEAVFAVDFAQIQAGHRLGQGAAQQFAAGAEMGNKQQADHGPEMAGRRGDLGHAVVVARRGGHQALAEQPQPCGTHTEVPEFRCKVRADVRKQFVAEHVGAGGHGVFPKEPGHKQDAVGLRVDFAMVVHQPDLQTPKQVRAVVWSSEVRHEPDKLDGIPAQREDEHAQRHGGRLEGEATRNAVHVVDGHVKGGGGPEDFIGVCGPYLESVDVVFDSEEWEIE